MLCKSLESCVRHCFCFCFCLERRPPSLPFLTVKCHSSFSRLASIKAACTPRHFSHSLHVHLHAWIKIRRRPARHTGGVIWSSSPSPLSWHLKVCNGHAWVRDGIFPSALRLSDVTKHRTKTRVKVSMKVQRFFFLHQLLLLFFFNIVPFDRILYRHQRKVSVEIYSCPPGCLIQMELKKISSQLKLLPRFTWPTTDG